MGYIPEKTLQDLELPEVLQQLSSFAITPLGKSTCRALTPLSEKDAIQTELKLVSEFQASFDNDNRIPNHGFEDLSEVYPLLKVENSVLEIDAFRNIASNTEITNTLLQFFKKFKTYYATLFEMGAEIEVNKEIKASVDGVIDRFGEVRNNASEALYKIRKEMQQLRGKISSSFNKALSYYSSLGYLDDIRESVIDHRRVLAVKAMHRRKVKGGIMGNSKTGSIVFIEPEQTHAYSRELQNLIFEETEEIKKILSQLTDYMRPFLPLIRQQQNYLLRLDTVYARARYAQEIHAVCPNVAPDAKVIDIKQAYHPLLYWTHRLENKTTHPQDIHLEENNRIVVISGPNAGGKSITLKTVGLLQLMLQSGILIPAHERSTMGFFDRILTDIGDNQSIENHLSTYSYRLKNMKRFLQKCDADTLFLIDEFGTGSDPELGGALAEAILEEFYNFGAFGLITTHYANLKALADELPGMRNANMQFDRKTLEPIFKLVMGEAGSSFTFEVAQKNGLPFRLINRAKKKIERGKVRFDETIAKLQKERTAMTKTEKSLRDKENLVRKESERLLGLNAKLKTKLVRYQELYDHNQRMVVLGNKFNEIAERFFNHNKKRPLISDLLQLVETENSKRKRKSAAVVKKKKLEQKKAEAEVKKEIVVIRKEKKKQKKEPPKAIPERPTTTLKVGDRVRMWDGKSIGSIDAIEKNKAVVNYGMFTTQVALDQLEFVK